MGFLFEPLANTTTKSVRVADVIVVERTTTRVARYDRVAVVVQIGHPLYAHGQGAD